MKKLHIKLSIVLGILITALSTEAQYITLNDTAFVSYLQGYVPNCLNGNQLDTSCPDLQTITTINIQFGAATDITGIEYFTNLQTLNVTYNELSFLPNLPASLVTLDCGGNHLTSISALPTGLKSLNCSENQLTSLPSLPNSLEYLYCLSNNIVTLPATLPDSLLELDVRLCQISVLPTLPSRLRLLACSNNPLSTLPVLPFTLRYLHCQNAGLSNIPAFNNQLMLIDIQGNSLTSLPALPSMVGSLDCSNNQLASLPVLPAGLQSLKCRSNNLTSLPDLTVYMTELDVRDNPGLHCLPKLKTVQRLYFDSTNISCLPNYGNVTNSIPYINNIPLCTDPNTHGCPVYYNISGSVYKENNGDCIKQVNEQYLPFTKLNLLQGGTVVQSAYTGGSGRYSFDTEFGNYNVEPDTTNIPFGVLCPIAGYDSATIVQADSFAGQLDFGMQCKSGYDIEVHSLVAERFRPGNETLVFVSAGDIASIYHQTCNTTNIGGQLRVSINGPVQYVSTLPGQLPPPCSSRKRNYI